MFEMCGLEPTHKKMPSCSSHYAVLNSATLADFQMLSPSDGHGPVHIQTGGTVLCMYYVLCTVYVLCMYCVCTVYVLCMYYVCTVYVLCMYYVCTMYVLCMYCVCTVYVLCIIEGFLMF
jgi:hypothetical protein